MSKQEQFLKLFRPQKLKPSTGSLNLWMQKKQDATCNHFAFLLNGKLTSTKMSDEAVDFFDALEKGMPYY